MVTTKEVVFKFAEGMENKLSGNRHKGDREGWLNCSLEYLFLRLQEEVKELEEQLNKNYIDSGAIASECYDIANFAMMITDKLIISK